MSKKQNKKTENVTNSQMEEEVEDTNVNKSESNMPALIINTQFLKDFSFEAPNAPAIFVEMKNAPEIKVSLDVKAAKINNDANLFQISLFVNVDAEYDGKKAFICETEYVAIATINVKPEFIEPTLLVEIPKYLFPFSRKIVSDATREGGFAPLMLQPVDFLSLYITRKNQEAKAQEAKAKEEKTEVK